MRVRFSMVRGPLAAGAGLVTLVVLGMAVGERARSGSGDDAIRHVPGRDVPRLPVLAEPPFEVSATLVRDFDATRDRLALLDPMDARVIVLRHDGSAWEPHVAFGRRGGGPGELRAPSGIALTADGGIVVADESRLHFYTAAGLHVRSTTPRTACTLTRPGVGVVRTGLLLHGACMRGERMDTVLAALYWSADGVKFVELATEVRYTRSGSLGSILGSASPLSEGDGRHLFGVGGRDCIHAIHDVAPRPRVEHICGLASVRYRAPAPAALEERLRYERGRRPEFRRLLRWPDVLPVYLGAVAAGVRDVLVRPYSADSVAFALAGSGGELLVAPQDGFVGCRREGCLWADHEVGAIRLTLLRTERLASAAARMEAR